MKKVLILGANGFIGQNIKEVLIKNKLNVLSPSSKECNLLNAKKITAYIAKYKPAIVINAAWIGVGVRTSFEKDYVLNNLSIATNILLACSSKKYIKKVIQLGSCNEYGDSENKLTESSPLQPKTLYGTTKAMVTLLSLEQARTTNVPFVTLRPFYLVGKHDNKGVLRYLVSSCLENKKITLSKGEQVRDYLYVGDLAQIIFEVCKSPTKLKDYEVYNVGSGKGIKLSEVFHMIFKKTKYKKKYKRQPYSKNEYFSQVADTTKLRKLLPFQLTPLDSAVDELIDSILLQKQAQK